MNPEYIADALLLVNEHKDVDNSANEAVRRRIAHLTEAHEWVCPASPNPMSQSDRIVQVLPARLPPMSRLSFEAQQAAAEAEKLALLKDSMSEALNEELEVPSSPVFEASPPQTLTRSSRASSISSAKAAVSGMGRRMPSFSGSGKANQPKKRNWESHDVYRAIE